LNDSYQRAAMTGRKYPFGFLEKRSFAGTQPDFGAEEAWHAESLAP
jgi:hypothetical protein